MGVSLIFNIRFGTGQRPPLALIEKVPGPGSYQTTKTIGDSAPRVLTI